MAIRLTSDWCVHADDYMSGLIWSLERLVYGRPPQNKWSASELVSAGARNRRRPQQDSVVPSRIALSLVQWPQRKPQRIGCAAFAASRATGPAWSSRSPRPVAAFCGYVGSLGMHSVTQTQSTSRGLTHARASSARRADMPRAVCRPAPSNRTPGRDTRRSSRSAPRRAARRNGRARSGSAAPD